jgi:hypothetical protein
MMSNSFFIPPVSTASAPDRNAVDKVFCFQKSNSATIRVLTKAETRQSQQTLRQLCIGINRRCFRSEFRSDYSGWPPVINAKNRPVSRAVFCLFPETKLTN